jgi:PAS domain S-box-containing protein
MAKTPAGPPQPGRIAELEKELAMTREELRSLQERHDAASRELEAVRTERMEVEETRARLSAIVESSDDAIVSKTLDGIVTSWNRAAEQMFGYTAAEAVGQHITLIIPGAAEREDEVLARLRRGEKVDHFETVRQAKDGRHLFISLTVSPIRDAARRVIGASRWPATSPSASAPRRRCASARPASAPWPRPPRRSSGGSTRTAGSPT